MIISYLILAHSNPAQVKRLIEKLNTDNVRFFIHIDANVDIEPFREQTSGHSNVEFVVKRINVEWGAFSVLEAYLESLRFIYHSAPDSYVIHLSGQDYPIKSNQYIQTYIDQHCDNIFLDHFALPYSYWAGNGGLDRIFNHSYIVGVRKRVSIKPLSLSWKNIEAIFSVMVHRPRIVPVCIYNFFRKRKPPIECINHYGGEFWISMPMSVAIQILDQIDKNKNIEKYYRLVGHADEVLLHTMLLNNKELASSVINNCLKHIDWSKKRNESPLTFTIEDKSDIENIVINMPDKLFARKFGSDSEIIDYIDLMTK